MPVVPNDHLYPELSAYLDARAGEFDRIEPARRRALDELASYVRSARASGEPVRLNFICTHNSRRSHFGQLWAAAAAARFAVHARTYSGGTEATAFNPRAVASAARAGFRIEQLTADDNAVYLVRMGESVPAMVCFSKAYNNPPNPSSGFAAVMVCSEADTACPAVHGAMRRFALPYLDPKASDGTPDEAATYDERCAQIAREMLYAMSLAAG